MREVYILLGTTSNPRGEVCLRRKGRRGSVLRQTTRRADVSLETGEDAENLVEQCREAGGVVQEVRDATQQVAKQVAGAWHRGDVEHNLVEVNDETQQVEV